MGIPLLTGIIVWGYRKAFGKPTWMETGTPVYFALAWLLSLLDNGFILTYGNAVGPLVLAGLWMGTLATSMPLTGHYSKWHYHPALWTNQVFIKTNAVITAAWVCIFLIQAAIALAGRFLHEQSFYLLMARHLMVVPGIVFTVWFMKWYPTYGFLKKW